MKKCSLSQGQYNPKSSVQAPDHLNAESQRGRLNFLKQRSRFRLISLAATALLCVLLASGMAQKGSNGLLKKKPSVVLQASTTLITLPCSESSQSISRSCPYTINSQVALTAVTKNFNKQILYAYTVGGGRVVGEGSQVTWDLGGVWPGIYTATVEVQDHKKHRALSSVTVKIVNCGDCVNSFHCPTIVVTCYDEVKAGTPATCKVVVRPSSDLITYEWFARDSSGEDLSVRVSGRGTSISIPSNGLGGKNITVMVEVKGLQPSCGQNASSSIAVKP